MNESPRRDLRPRMPPVHSGKVKVHRAAANLVLFGAARTFGTEQLKGDALAELLLSPALPLQSPGRRLLSLVCDGVLKVENVPLAWDALPQRYCSADGMTIEWSSPAGVIERRLLGSLTCLTLVHAQHPSFKTACADLMNHLHRTRWLPPSQTDPAKALEFVVGAISTRFMTALPGDLYAHIRGDQLMAAVSRACLARRDSGLALQRSQSHDTAVLRRTRSSLADRLEGPSHNSSSTDQELMTAVKARCAVPTNTNVRATQRTHIREGLLALVELVDQASPVAALFWFWAVTLVEKGTEHTQPLAPNTIEDYVSALSGIYLSPARELLGEGASIESAAWRDLLQQLLHSPDVLPSQLGKVQAALESFHFMLEQTFGIPPCGDLTKVATGTNIRANVVWEHERLLVLDTLRQRDLSQRYNHQLLVAFALFSDEGCPMRAQDLGHMHVGGVPLGSEGKVILIDPLPSAGRGKRVSARRHIEPKRPLTIALIKEWRLRRAHENAPDSALLFADPSTPGSVYAGARMTLELNSLLKEATGDAVSLHTLRHTALSDAGDAGVGLQERSAQAGQADVGTAQTRYVHLYDVRLRTFLDSYWHELRITEAQACTLTGLRPGRLRQRWHRHPEIPKQTLTWGAIEEVARKVQSPGVCDGISLSSPPPLVEVRKGPAGPKRVADMLVRLAAGENPVAVRLLFDICDDEWAALNRVLEMGRFLFRQRIRTDECRRGLKDGNVPFGKGFSRLGQPKLAAVVAHLARTRDRAGLHMSVEAWTRCLHNGWVSAERPAELQAWFYWLREAGFKGRQFVICSESSAKEAALESADWVDLVFGESPANRHVQLRGGRPRTYLMVVEEKSARDESANASTSTNGLNAIMLAAWVWLRMSEQSGIDAYG